MATIELGYGRSSNTFEYDDSRFDVLEPDETDAHPLPDNEVNAALDAPIDSPPLEESISPGDTVLIVASDARITQPSASATGL